MGAPPFAQVTLRAARAFARSPVMRSRSAVPLRILTTPVKTSALLASLASVATAITCGMAQKRKTSGWRSEPR